ncbi:Beta-glucosidase 22, partial [Trichinella patagoniensis]
MAGYDRGIFAPGRCSYPFGMNCKAGNSTTEPYIVVHNSLLAHSQVVKLYKDTYQAIQKGWIGMNVYTIWYYPLTNSSADIEAAQRVRDFMIGWIIEPLVFGDYPMIMKKNAGSRLPSFTQKESEQVKGSFDFISLNHYTSSYVADNSEISYTDLRDYNKDMFAKTR